ncbi:unnamed protein product [Rhizoctonia solani]|uniref:Uncharacterized protein n=1 Tax=Rhizoctonia solani TaxID=456999 RepID=A0A8H3CSD2_9AGAM|nr:unnamed protein product [Rhizoctonia solani]
MTPSPQVLFQLRTTECIALLVILLASLLPKGVRGIEPPSTDVVLEIRTVVRAIQTPRKQLIVLLLSLVALTALLDGSVTVANALFKRVFETKIPAWKGSEFYSVVLFVTFTGFAIVSLLKEAHHHPIWQSKLLKLFVFVALLFDTALAILIPIFIPIWRIRSSTESTTPGILDSAPSLGITPALHFGLTVFRVLILAVLFTTLFFPRVTYEPIEQNESVPRTDETPLLIPGAVAASTQSPAEPGSSKPKYGTFNGSNTTPPGGASTSAPGTSGQAPTIPVLTEPTWYENGARLMRLTSYLWPSRNIGLQLLAFICLLIVAVGRIVNAAIPFQFSTVVDTLAQPDAPHGIWGPLLWYIVLRFLSGSGGLNALRSVLWAPVIQFSDRSLSQLAFDHLLNLSLAWHTRRKTGEVLRILDRGASIKQIFELLIFTLLPTAADTFIAVWIFFWYFGPAMSVFIATTMVLYVTTSAMITNRINNLSRRMVETDITTRGVHTDSLLNYETVKYFNGEAHEGERYHEALSRVQQFQLRVTASLNLMSLSQNLVLTAGLLVGSLLIIFDSTHQDVMKRFVVFITYLAELYSPLTAFALLYRTISQSLVDAERLLDLLDEPSEVRDKPSAKDLVVTDGVIEFDNVTFSYDGRATALKGVSFKVPKGGSLALVGESGSGKSTILKLLYRFYDLAPSDGAIRIDGQDIRDVTQASLRRAIGIVPQDCVLFNNTIAYNIGYGKLGSSTEEIENAARAAQIHERIISFPDGYETIVGERGVRLSGGEKQRVGIARTILKASPVILLDEATSALDTSTERDIQKALQNLTEGRSSVSIAHRLSTISKSDLIFVFHQGEIIESGTQRKLIELGGRFAAMWTDQVSSVNENRVPPQAAGQNGPGTPPETAVTSGLHVVSSEKLVPTGVASKHPEPIKPKRQEPSSDSTHEVRPDVTFAAVASSEPTASQLISNSQTDN